MLEPMDNVTEDAVPDIDSAMDMLAATEASMNAESEKTNPETTPTDSSAKVEGEPVPAAAVKKENNHNGTVTPTNTTGIHIPPKSFRLFVGQIPQGTTMQQFSEFCQTIGAQCDFLKEGTERPFGFINVADEESRDYLLSHTQKFKDVNLSITLAKSKTVKFFLGGITKETSEEMIKNHFSQFGNVQEAFVVKNRGFGFVSIESQQIKVLDAIPNGTHQIDGRTIDVKVAQPKKVGGGGRGFGYGGYGGYGGGYPGPPPPYGGYGPYPGGYGYGPYAGGYGGYAGGYAY